MDDEDDHEHESQDIIDDSEDPKEVLDKSTPSSSDSNYDFVLKDKLSICFDLKLLELARTSVEAKCKHCGCDVTPGVFQIGSSSQIRWTCSNGHKVPTWSSQPVVKNMQAGNFLLATNILLSGKNYAKIAQLFKFMNLGCVGKSTFYTVEWNDMVKKNHDDMQGKDLIISAKNEPEIKHSNDIWHGAKSVSKKISKAVQKSENRPLAIWAKHTVNHFWYCAKNCEGSPDKFLAIWRGHTHHVVNKHEWVSGDSCIEPACGHDEIAPDHPDIWLKPGSAPHRALEKIVFDQRLIKSIPYFVNFRHTGNIESFHSFKLMYASKRHSYSPPIYKARCLLAAIDYNTHIDRELKRSEDGKIKYGKKFSKRSNTWSAVLIRSAKTYAYIPEFIKSIFWNIQVPSHGMSRLIPVIQEI